MFKLLPLILLTHNIDQRSNCIGPCFGTTCPTGMHCYNGECCDEPYSILAASTESPIAPPTPPDFNTNRPPEPAIDTLKFNRLITPIPSIPSIEYPTNNVVTNRQIVNSVRPTCVDASPSCGSINHLCSNVIYEIVMIRQCSYTCGKCSSVPVYPQHSRRPISNTCLDYGRNCGSLKHLCKNSAYSSLLQRVCQNTCLCS